MTTINSSITDNLLVYQEELESRGHIRCQDSMLSIHTTDCMDYYCEQV